MVTLSNAWLEHWIYVSNSASRIKWIIDSQDPILIGFLKTPALAVFLAKRSIWKETIYSARSWGRNSAFAQQNFWCSVKSCGQWLCETKMVAGLKADKSSRLTLSLWTCSTLPGYKLGKLLSSVGHAGKHGSMLHHENHHPFCFESSNLISCFWLVCYFWNAMFKALCCCRESLSDTCVELTVMVTNY